MTREAIEQNAETYKTQVFKILDPEKTEVRFNSQWLAPLRFEDMVRLCSKYTVARILERDDFLSDTKKARPSRCTKLLLPAGLRLTIRWRCSATSKWAAPIRSSICW